MVTTFYPPLHMGGDAIYVQALARALQRRGHTVEVAHCEDAYHVAGGVASRPATGDADIIVHRLQSAWGALSPLITQQTGQPGPKRKPLAAIFARDFDVIHFHNISLIGGPGVLSMGVARLKLYSLHDHWLLCPTHIFWKNRERACERPTCWSCCIRSGIPPQLWRAGDFVQRQLEHVDLMLAPSEFTARKHREAGISRPIDVLPLFSRLDAYRGAAMMRPERPRFLFVGRVTASKGIRTLVEAFAAFPGYDLWVAGEGDLRMPLEEEFQAARNVRFLGDVVAQDLPALYASSTATVVPSLAPETFGLVAVESFACSTPVIVREAGGCAEVVHDSGAGIVCSDMEALVAAIHHLARNPEIARAMGRVARNVYEKQYTEATHLDSYLDRVQRLIASDVARQRH